MTIPIALPSSPSSPSSRRIAALALCSGLALCVPITPDAAPAAGNPGVAAKSGSPKTQKAARKQRGVASFYADWFEGRKTANGEIFDNDALTAAHRTLPMGTRVRVTDTDSGRAVTVRVNDRGPYVPGRTIDLTKRAGEALGMIQDGIADVTVEVLGQPPG